MLEQLRALSQDKESETKLEDSDEEDEMPLVSCLLSVVVVCGNIFIICLESCI